MNYLNVTYEQLLQDFRARLNSDPRFKNIGSATIYGMFQEMLCACMDMTNFYLQRTADWACPGNWHLRQTWEPGQRCM